MTVTGGFAGDGKMGKFFGDSKIGKAFGDSKIGKFFGGTPALTQVLMQQVCLVEL